MMPTNIDRSMFHVNRSFYLTVNRCVDNLPYMRYGERLKAARDHAKLSQAQLAEQCGIQQPTVSYLENPKSKATGSEFTARFARACGVSVDWLSDEIGAMMPALSEPAQQMLAILSTMTEREQYRFVRMADTFAKDDPANDCGEPGHCGESEVAS
jgi:transcriptional regulator with XRE-family HTH domain